MAILSRTIVAAVLAVGGLAIGTQSASAASYSHIDRLALELRGDAGRLYSEFRQHYRHAAHYRHLISDASQMYRLADHIHDLAHRGTLGHMDSDLEKLDRLFHHLEGLVDEIEHDARHDHFGHGGHTHGNTRHVRRLLDQMEDTLHHLHDDIRSARRPTIYPVPGHVRPAPHRIPHHGGRGIAFGNGQFQLRLGF